MIPAGHLLAFALISFALIVVPGPNVLFVISRSLQLGRVAGVGTAFGGEAGVYLQVVAVAFGVGVLVERSVAVFTVIKLAGAAYLIYLGVQAVRHRRSLAESLGVPAAKKTPLRILRDGFLVGATNGAVFIGIAAVSDAAWAVAAGSARAWLGRSPRRMELIGGTSGLVMIGLGASLAVTGRKD
jgi:threonine/homoserine/homoserine lactone efflux protein